MLALPAAERDALIAKWTASLTELKDGQPHWRAENGVLVNDGLGGYATTIRDYGDFELRLEYKLAAGADSGIYLRGVPQVQIWDTNIPEKNPQNPIGYALGSGGLWNNPKGTPGRDPLVKADKPVGEWNRYTITCKGPQVTVVLNGETIIDANLDNWPETGKNPDGTPNVETVTRASRIPPTARETIGACSPVAWWVRWAGTPSTVPPDSWRCRDSSCSPGCSSPTPPSACPPSGVDRIRGIRPARALTHP